jgi:hypothetical protein
VDGVWSVGSTLAGNLLRCNKFFRQNSSFFYFPFIFNKLHHKIYCCDAEISADSPTGPQLAPRRVSKDGPVAALLLGSAIRLVNDGRPYRMTW